MLFAQIRFEELSNNAWNDSNMLAMRICLGLLGCLHGIGTTWLLVLASSEPLVESVVTVMLCLLLSGDLISVSLAITRVKSTGVLLSGAAANVIAVVMFCAIPFTQSNQELVEALGMIIADGTILPLLGPLLVNAFVLFGLDFVLRRNRFHSPITTVIGGQPRCVSSSKAGSERRDA